MKMSAVGWIGTIIGVIGGLVGMIVGIMASPVFGSIFSIVMIAIFAFAFGPLIKGASVDKRLMQSGVSATARIVKVTDTGVTVNNSPQIKLLLEITPPNGSPYMVEKKQLISRLQTYDFQPGGTLPVKIDLDNKNVVAIDYSGGSTASSYSGAGANQYSAPVTTVPVGPWAGIGQAEADKRLLELNAQNVSLMSSGEPGKAIIQKYTWMGIYVGPENNEVAQLDLEVLPQSGSPFKAQTIAVIKATSVVRYQAGCEVFVAYDRNDNSKVTVTHS